MTKKCQERQKKSPKSGRKWRKNHRTPFAKFLRHPEEKLWLPQRAVDFLQGALKGTNLRGQTEPKLRFSQIFADFCRFSPFPRKQSIWETQIFAENRRFSQETAENRRSPQIGVCPLRFVPLIGIVQIKGVFGKGVGNSKNVSEMRQKCVKMGLVELGNEERSKMRQKCVKIVSKMRQKIRGTPLGENTFWTIPT